MDDHDDPELLRREIAALVRENAGLKASLAQRSGCGREQIDSSQLEVALQALRRERDLAALVMETSPTAIVLLDREGRITLSNAAAQRVLGIDAEALVQRSYNSSEWQGGDHAGRPLRDEDLPFRRALDSGETARNVPLAVTTPAGGRVLLRVSAAPVKDAQGAITGVVTTFEDVTAQVGLEAALLDMERRARSFVEASPMGIHMYDLREDGELLFVGANRAADAILGVDNSQFIGKTIAEAFPPLLATDVPERYRRAARLGEPWHTQVVQYDDQRISGAYEVYAFQTSAGSMAALFLDIGPRLRAEQEKARLEARLRQQQKLESIGTLAAGVAHEINNPLNGILNYGELIQARLPEGDPLRRYAQSIIRESERVSVIVRDLLAFSRQERQQHSPARMADIVGSTLTLVQALFRKDQIQITTEVPDGLPSLKCRSQQVQQVLLNLLTNARDALIEKHPGAHPDKQIAIRVSLFERDGGRWLRTTVEDRGNGIPPETGERIFDPFFTTKPRERGTGLGLAVSYGIAHDHHGELSFESEPGRGTRFHLDLPVDNGGKQEERAEGDR
jgi:PAS domain S-box-containing protein